MKRIALIFMSILIAFNLIMPPEVAKANIVSKPITIAAKKVAKDLAKDTAVQMANQIVSEYLVKELIDGVKTDTGYSAVCMDGPKNNMKDCAPEKRAQVKTNLSETDKANLTEKVESVLEKKTLTSSKWGKFLDYFVPIFLISGTVSFISSALNGDILSFFDEIAQEALIESGYLKPLNYISTPSESGYVEKDFSAYVASASVSLVQSSTYHMTIVLKPNKEFKVHYRTYHGTNFTEIVRGTFLFQVNFRATGNYNSDRSAFIPALYIDGFIPGTGLAPIGTYPKVDGLRLWEGAPVPVSTPNHKDVAKELGKVQADAQAKKYLLTSATDVNSVMNKFIDGMHVYMAVNGYKFTFSNVPDLSEPVKPPPHQDYGQQTATDKIKNPDGTVSMKGINSFTFKYGDTYIYPSGDSQTGWKNKTTGEDITVVEDDVVVDDSGNVPPDEIPPTDDDSPPDKDKNKQELEDKSKKLGNLVTTRFPFSLPWDFMAMMKLLYAEPMTPKWNLSGSEKIPFDFTIDLKFLDPYISWFRGFVLAGFVMSVIFMHGRFMGGSK